MVMEFCCSGELYAKHGAAATAILRAAAPQLLTRRLPALWAAHFPAPDYANYFCTYSFL